MRLIILIWFFVYVLNENTVIEKGTQLENDWGTQDKLYLLLRTFNIE